jgi:hypothetical protein
MPTEPDYRKISVTGERWRRCCHGEFDNASGATPWIRFDFEDRVALADGESIGTPAASVVRRFDTPDSILDLRNPETGLPTGQTLTHAELYAVLWSLAMESAEMADAAAAAP